MYTGKENYDAGLVVNIVKYSRLIFNPTRF